MPTKRINYAVIALKKEEVEDVINKLSEQGADAAEKKDNKRKAGLDELIKWLKENKEKIYGELPEEWRPFYDKRIIDIIKDNSNYLSKTDLIGQLDNNCKNTDILDKAEIRIFFIDAFAMYLSKYIKFADKLDAKYNDAEKANCCFLINYSLPTKCQEQLEETYKDKWPTLSRAYMDGSLHRIAVRIDDLNNFKNMVRKEYNKPAMNQHFRQIVDEEYGPTKTKPQLTR
jgi:hypothetical protein